jgi:putative oxidoreductase
MALLAGGGEFFGGLLIIAGLMTRLAALSAAITMLVAIVSVHLANGFFISNNGYEYAFALLTMAAALIIRGAGSVSLDRLFNTTQ